ncbi:MAG: type II toxin-antitoxin system prevent-host-death family antitoxin [Candidatus Omnitrophota bacterium]|nr:type II toxin-antitoxin system prevent-host-death family antitoxin [Candidatus Omnitrophota bacterium]
MIRFVNIRKLKGEASAVIRASRKGDIVVTSRGKPQAVLHAVSEEDLEDYLLVHSPKFLRSLAASYREYRRKGGIALEKLIAETERELARVSR